MVNAEPLGCYFCGEFPEIVIVSDVWINAEHHICNGEPGVSICNSPSVDSAILAWNKWQKKMQVEFLKQLRLL